ncbi:MAG: lectin-like protein, partial [Kiritimatiellae bacterium]|nr:lectin-like protein [Kiritimatiellia bacterium]
ISGHIVGTPGFMAPERIDARAIPLNASSDIYSLGAILYSILSLRPPLKISTYKTQSEMLQAIRANLIQPPIELNQTPGTTDPNETPAPTYPHCPEGRIPDALSRIAMHALAKEPVKRYQSVLELQQDIEAYQNGTCWQVVGDYDMTNPTLIEHWDIYGGHYEVSNTGLRVFGGRPQVLLLRQEVPGDVRIEYECQIQSVNLDNLGCFISAINGGNKNGIPFTGYEFSYGAFNNSIIQLSRADHKIWSQAASPLQRNTTFHIVAERSGNTLSLTVNDQCIFCEKDTDPLSGAERTAVGLYSWETDIHYKKITIYARGIPWHADILDIAERQLQKGHYNVAKAIYNDILDSRPNEKRLLRAREGLEKAYRREQRDADVRKWQRMLEEAWPSANPKLSMVNDELSVEVAYAGIDDLTPLIGLPITTLYCQNNRIRSLEPLRGMRLELLSCSDNPITSLEPLAGMPLRSLYAENCPVSSLEPLRDIPLTLLNVGGAGFIETLEPLAGMELVFFSCWGNKISSLEPLRGMPLSGLFCGDNQLDNLEPLRGMPIRMLQVSGNRLRDLTPLEEVKLTWLHCANNLIEDLTPLRNSNLVLFSCQGNHLRDLAPVDRMQIATITCGNNLLKDIGHLLENPPRDFAFDCETIPDAALRDMAKHWRTRPEWERHAENADTLLALRQGHIRELFDRAHPFKEHRYLFIPRFMTWQAAADFCRRIGGSLLTILSAEENEFVIRLFPNGCWIWLGLTQTPDGLQWITGEPLSYHNFTDPIQRHKTGRKTFNGSWCTEDIPGVENCFVIKWRNDSPPNDTLPPH